MTTTSSAHTEPFRIYVLSLDDQMHDVHHGAWIDFRQLDDIDDASLAIEALMTASPTAKTLGRPTRNWVIANWDGWCGIEVPRDDYPASLWLRYETLSSLLEEGYSPDAIRDYVEWSGDDRFDAVSYTHLAGRTEGVGRCRQPEPEQEQGHGLRRA